MTNTITSLARRYPDCIPERLLSPQWDSTHDIVECCWTLDEATAWIAGSDNEHGYVIVITACEGPRYAILMLDAASG